LSTKIHAVVEGLGQLAKWCLTGGQTHDVTQAVSLLEGICAGAVLADKAYDADEVLRKIEGDGAKAVIPLKNNRKQQRAFDAEQYKNRNLIERFFCRIKQFRRIATRYEKLASRYSSFIALTASFIWLA
jgi:transposase